jgi:hypothetical protein
MLRRRALAAIDLDQRLGGAANLAAAGLPVPAGFTAEPVAAGLTAPLGVSAACDGLLYVAEAGHPNRTPPRLLRLDPETGIASVIASFEALHAPAALSVAGTADAVYAATPDTIWRVDCAGDEALPLPRMEPSLRGRVGAGPCEILPGAAVWRGAMYICDAGSPAGAPGTGLLWRVAPPGWRAQGAPAQTWRAPARAGRRRSVAAIAASGGVLVVALGLAWLYHERRTARRARRLT